jgi:hypothetical protein
MVNITARFVGLFLGPPVGVGMNIDIASIDMVSEVNMVSTRLSLSQWFVGIALILYALSFLNETQCTAWSRLPVKPMLKHVVFSEL